MTSSTPAADRPAGATPRRTVRVSDPVWTSAAQRARDDGTTLSAAINAFLADYGAVQSATDSRARSTASA